MSAIAGILHLYKRPVNHELLRQMIDCVAQKGPDGAGLWTGRSVGLGHRKFCATEESLRETQPTPNHSRTCWITFDGRVDSRDTLISRLGSRVDKSDSPTDVDLLMSAYEMWGTECLKWVIGDYAFALWDEIKQQLFCGRDTFGIRPFYYHFDGKTFTFASDVLQIFQNPQIPVEVDEEKVAEWFTSAGQICCGYRDTSRSFFRGIFELPHAHYLVVNPAGLRLSRYWDPEPRHRIRYRDTSMYGQHFYHLFREAVRDRLRTSGAVGAELSGGFDSSSIVCTAAEICASDRAATDKFAAFSLVYDELSCDERPLISKVVEKTMVKSRTLVADDLCGFQNFPPRPGGYAEISFPSQPHTQEGLKALYDAAYAEGTRVMLSGDGAESHVLGNQFVLESLIRSGRWGELFRRLNQIRSGGSLRTSMSSLLRYGLTPLLPQRLSRSIYHKWMYGGLDRPNLPSWFTQEFQRKILRQASEQKIRLTKQRWFGDWGLQLKYDALNPSGPMLHVQFGTPIERRFPYHDRRILEFCLAIPPEQKYGQSGKFRKRALQKLAFDGVVPHEILQSQRGIDFDDVTRRRLIRHKDAYLEMFAPSSLPLVAQYGFVGGERLWAAVKGMLAATHTQDPKVMTQFARISLVTQLEIWLWNIESIKSRRGPAHGEEALADRDVVTFK